MITEGHLRDVNHSNLEMLLTHVVVPIYLQVVINYRYFKLSVLKERCRFQRIVAAYFNMLPGALAPSIQYNHNDAETEIKRMMSAFDEVTFTATKSTAPLHHLR